MTTSRFPRRSPSARQRRFHRRSALAGYVATLLLAGFVLQVMRIYSPALGLSTLFLVLLVLVAFFRPATSLGVLIVLVLVGDARSMAWWPVVKNLSSGESIFYISNGAVVSPLEITLGAITAIVLAQHMVRRKQDATVRLGALAIPMLLFFASVIFGLIWGLGRGGDLRVALFEARPLLYFPVVYALVMVLFTSVRHYRALAVGIVAALTVEAIHGLWSISEDFARESTDRSPVEHTAALHMNVALIMLIATFLFGTKRIGIRPALLLAGLPITVLYLVAERRAAVVGLVFGVLVLLVALSVRNRSRFMVIVPTGMLLLAAYTAVFWNATNSRFGFPAQAVKIIILPDSAGADDVSSDLYRDIENFAMITTVRSEPLTGIGFGNPFLRPIPLPDISFFEFYEYIPHNSIMWMWTKVGIVGFLAFLFLFASATGIGVRATSRLPDPLDAVIVGSFAAYIPMVFVVAFVDITFDAQTTTLLGAAMAAVASAERLAGLPPPTRRANEAEPIDHEPTPQLEDRVS